MLPLLVLVLVLVPRLLRRLLLLTCVDFPKSPLPVRWNDGELSTLFKALHSFRFGDFGRERGGASGQIDSEGIASQRHDVHTRTDLSVCRSGVCVVVRQDRETVR